MGLLLLLLCFAVTGCDSGKSARAKVKGRVKFFDKNLTAGTVGFVTKDGRIGVANIDFDGNYEMNDAPIGEVTITVKVPTTAAGPAAGGPPAAPKDLPPMQPPGGAAAEKSFAPVIDPRKIVQIPGRYGSAESSGLKYTVEKGDQTHNITLSP